MPKVYVPLHLDHFDDDRRLGCEDPAILLAELVLMTASRSIESDGRLSRLQARRALAGIPAIADPDDVLFGLEEAELAVVDEGGALELPGWQRWMKSRAELDAYRQTQSEYGRQGGRPAKGQAKRRTKANPSDPEKGDPFADGNGEPKESKSHLTLPDTDLTGPDLKDHAAAVSSTATGDAPPAGGLAAAVLGIDPASAPPPRIDWSAVLAGDVDAPPSADTPEVRRLAGGS